jgi:hypothetical protein
MSLRRANASRVFTDLGPGVHRGDFLVGKETEQADKGRDGVWIWPRREELRGMEARDLEGDERRRRRG